MWRVIVLFTLVSCSSTNIKEKWGSFKSPTLGDTKSIGSYNAGCLDGAQTLPLNTLGLVQMRPARQKYYGHPTLLSFLENLGEKFYQKQKKFLLVGDLSQPRGGPTINGHASHQTGLDVDIWFDFVKKRRELSYMDLEHMPALKYIRNNKLYNWNKDHEQLILMSVMDQRVDRVFVSPPIKKYFCDKKLRPEYLKKIRPWWGHKDHVHVRLKCPKNEELCEPQAAIKSVDCEKNLDWWFGDGPSIALSEMKESKKEITLPKKCEEVKKFKRFNGYKI